MVLTCSVSGCKSKGSSARFFRLPRIRSRFKNAKLLELTEKREKAWIIALNRKELTPERYKNVRICSRHFIGGQPSGISETTSPDWVPTLFLDTNKEPLSMDYVEQIVINRSPAKTTYTPKPSKPKATTVVSPQKILVPKIEVFDSIEPQESLEQDSDDPMDMEFMPEVTLKIDCGSQTDFTTENLTTVAQKTAAENASSASAYTKSLEMEIQYLNTTLNDLKNKYNALSLSRESFENDDAKTNYYTGFPSFECVSKLFSTIENHIPERESMSKFQQYMMFLMRMRLCFGVKDLGYRFKMGLSKAQKILHDMIDICYQHHTIQWVDGEDFRQKIPPMYRTVSGDDHLIIILNFIEVTSNKTKKENCKYLIASIPQSQIVFVSKGFNAVHPDFNVIDECGVLDKLSLGDVIICNKDTNMNCYTIGMSEGRKILIPFEWHANHSERIFIKLKNKFKLLSEGNNAMFELKDKVTNLTDFDKILSIACCYYNVG